jgi:putative DNA primase/helicase
MRGTPAEKYLRNRGLSVPDCQDMRYDPRAWHWKARQYSPAILCRVTDVITNEPLTVHMTFITEDGQRSPLQPRKLMLAGHQKQGGVIRLCRDDEVTGGLGLTEGVETGLTVMAGGWRPVWAAVDSGNLAGLPVLPGVGSLTVFADNDEAGIKAAETLCQRWFDAGREARINPAPKGDWNDHAAT